MFQWYVVPLNSSSFIMCIRFWAPAAASLCDFHKFPATCYYFSTFWRCLHYRGRGLGLGLCTSYFYIKCICSLPALNDSAAIANKKCRRPKNKKIIINKTLLSHLNEIRQTAIGDSFRNIRVPSRLPFRNFNNFELELNFSKSFKYLRNWSRSTTQTRAKNIRE